MKKVLLFLLIVCAFVCICSAEGWDKSSPHFIFDTPEAVEAWEFEGMEKTFEMGNAKIVTTFWDPVMWYSFPDDEKFNAADYKWFAISMKVTSNIRGGTLFYATTAQNYFDDPRRFNFGSTNDGKWSSSIVEITKTNWSGTISTIRLDPINPSPSNPCAGSVIYVNRLGFFKTKEEAEAFAAEGAVEKYDTFMSFSGTLCEAFIPANTLVAGYKESEYLLTSSTPEGTGDEPVVMYTDANGNTSPVAMSYTNTHGYSAYVATKAGKYTLGYNRKEYTDIAGHWGEKYINFASDRNIFQGTDPGVFSPDMALTRGMFITVLGRMAEVDTARYSGDTGYTDVKSDMYYAPYIKWAAQKGIMAGTSKTAFEPDAPMARADMALAINNYIASLDWDVHAYVLESASFNDLSDCTAEQVEAIIKIADIGIINGISEGVFAPDQALTRAEMCTVMERMVRAIVGLREIKSEYTHEYISRDRIRIGMWGVTEAVATAKGMKQLDDLGVDFIVHGSAISKKSTRELVLSYADLYGIEVIVDGYYTPGKTSTVATVEKFIENADPKVSSASYADHPSLGGHFFIDEPGLIDFAAVGKAIDDYEEQMPGMIAMTNLFPNYATKAQLDYGLGTPPTGYDNTRGADYFYKHCLDWANSNNSDYICADFYPLGTGGTRDKHVEGLAEVAKVARDTGREFWCCIQAFGWTSGMRTPNEADYRWQCYTLLAMGCTGILWWTYVGDVDYPALIDPVTLEPTQAYYDSQAVISEITKLSDTFVQYKNLGIYAMNTAARTAYLNMREGLEYEDFDAITVSTKSPLLVGCFEKKDNADGKAFTIVNMEELLQKKNASVTVTINETGKNVYSYRAGERQAVELDENGSFTVTLDCGEGIFYTIE